MFALLLIATLVFLALTVPFWGGIAIAIAVAIVQGYWILALILALCADVVFGAPVGVLYMVSMPFVAVTLVVLVGRFYFVRLLRGGVQTTL